MNIKLLIVLMLASVGAIAAEKPVRDPMSEPKVVLDERPEISTSAPHGWHKEDLVSFTLYLPPGMKYVKQQGIDSFVGAFEGKKLNLGFGFGNYTETAEDHFKRGGRGILRRYKIAGRPVDFVYTGDLGVWAAFHPEVEHGRVLGITASAKTAAELKTAEIIFRTVRIKTLEPN